MKKVINYNCFRQVLPPIPTKSKRKSKEILCKYIFSFKNDTEDINGIVTINISFHNSSRIININCSDTEIKANHNGNVASIILNDFKKSKTFKLHLLISNFKKNDLVKIESETPEVFLEKYSEDIPERLSVINPFPLKYHFLIASALQEEIEPFLKGKKWEYLDEQRITKVYKVKNSFGRIFNVLIYSINKMGMPFNGVAITKIIEQQHPKYVLFIGTCAGLKKTEKLKEGDILIPDYIYAYDMGKYNDVGNFLVEHRNYDVSTSLISQVNDMISKNRKYRFNIEPSCGFCSGASVVSSKKMRDKITKVANRKVMGFDMEAYIIAIINQLYSDVDTLVIKGIMDFGENKNDSYKEKAKNNAAKVANDLIHYIIENEKQS